MPINLSAVASLVKSLRQVADRYPVTRGMVTYAILWPSGNLLQQTLDKSRDWWDLREAARYGLYGSLITAPLLHHWLQLLTRLLPGASLSQAVAKGYIDQLVFAPFNISQFFVGMSLLEGHPMDEALEEWSRKFLSTWMISLSVWPLIQSLNFGLVPAKNRVMAMSLGSFLWMVFISYMQHTRADDLPEGLSQRRVHYDYHDGPTELFGHRPSA
ncbi:PXMP2/4 family protein 4 [Chionoecetes opilio]|uniref:PXMP2/4 family protein 4 n=1 Tax=Chionoecetes opilio TaxID=41210 RepID=A0A8J5BXE6_CHIOP|nr:PXMP2/4 family protein 4 [Chionoecetes opilio]